MPELLHTELELRWSDCDQYGHLNNVALVRLMEEARIRLFGLPDLPGAFGPQRPALADLGTDTFTIVAGQRVEYVAELGYHGQSIAAQAWLSRLGGKSFTMDCRFTDLGGTTEYLIGSVTVVVMDLASRRPRAMTETETAELSKYVGPGVTFR